MGQTGKIVDCSRKYFKLALFSNLFLSLCLACCRPSFASCGIYSLGLGLLAMLLIWILWRVSPVISSIITKHRSVSVALARLLAATQCMLLVSLLFIHVPVIKLATAFGVCWAYLAALSVRAAVSPVPQRHFAACASLLPAVLFSVLCLCTDMLPMGRSLCLELPYGPINRPLFSQAIWLLYAELSAATVPLVVLMPSSSLDRMGEFCRQLPNADLVTAVIGGAMLITALVVILSSGWQPVVDFVLRYVDLTAYDPFEDALWFVIALCWHIIVWRCLILWPPD